MNKKLLITLAALGSVALSNPVFAVSRPGLYLGGQLGWGNTDYNIDRTFQTLHLKKAGEDGLAGRGYVGFQFSPFLGLETGLAMFSDVSLAKHVGKIKTYQWDVLAKVGTPLGDSHLRADLKFGAAEIFSDFKIAKSAHDSGVHLGDRNVIKPVAGASLTYDFCNNVYMDLSYLHGFGDFNGHKKHFSPNTDLVTLGVGVAFTM